MVYLMTNGEGMRGGRLHHNIADHRFIAEAQTAAKYRFFSIRDEFPGIVPVGPELGVIELADGTATLSMVLRPDERDRHTDITEHGSWRVYRESLK